MQNFPMQYPYPGIMPPPMYNMYPYPYWGNQQMYNMPPYPYFNNQPIKRATIDLIDYGPNPFAVDIDKATNQNNTFRTVLWTGDHLQVALMSIDVGDDIGLEVHTESDQFIRIEEGNALIRMGDSQDNLNFQKQVFDDFAIMIPAGKWHNIINAGNTPLKLYAIYAPPEHPRDTVQQTKPDSEAAENRYRYRY